MTSISQNPVSLLMKCKNILHFPSHDTWFSKTKVKQIVTVTISKVLWALHFIGGGTRKNIFSTQILSCMACSQPTEQKATLS